MRAETFIARRLYFSDQSSVNRSGAARPAVRVALAGISIGVLVMLLTLCVVVGFKQTVTEKVALFGAHIRVVNYENNNTYELRAIAPSDSLICRLSMIEGVESVQRFYTKPGIIKTDDAFQGVVVNASECWDVYREHLREGRLPEQANEVLISARQASQLRLKTGDSFLCYFVEEQVRVRKLVVAGIYYTGFSESDELFVLSYPSLICQLNGWSEQQCSGLQLRVTDLRQLEPTADRVYFATANRLDEDGNALYTETLVEQHPQIFAWLDLLDMNVVVILLLMLCVSAFTIVCGLIILILDSISLIGTLKALGADNRFIRRIFITEAAMLVSKGVLYGNILALLLAATQYFLRIIPLDAATYYVDYVPVAFPWLWIILLNIGFVLLSWLVLLLPSAIIAHIHPARVMHFE